MVVQTLKLEAAFSLEIFVNIYQSTQRHIQEVMNLHQQFCENLKSSKTSLHTGHRERVNNISWEKKMETPQYHGRVYCYDQEDTAILQYI
jgi:hypothetical protein